MTPDIIEVAKVVTVEGGKSPARSMGSKHSNLEKQSPSSSTAGVNELLGEGRNVLSRQLTPEKESIEDENEMGAKLSRERDVSRSLSRDQSADVSQSSDSATPRPQSDASRATSRTLTPRRSDSDKGRKSNSGSRVSAKSRQEEELALDLNLKSRSEGGSPTSRSSSRHSSVISPLKPMKSPQKGPIRVSSGGEGHSSAGARQSLQSRESERSSRVTLSRTSLASSMSARSLKSKTEYVEERKYLRSLQGDNSDYDIDLSTHSALSHSRSRAAASVKSDRAASVKSDRAASVKSDRAASVKSDRAASVKSKKLGSSQSSSSGSELEYDKRKSPGSHLSVRSKSRSKPVGMVGFELKDEVEVSDSSEEEERVVAAAGRLSSRKHLTPGSRPTSSASNKSRIMSAREYAQRSLSTDAAPHEREDSSDHYSDIFSSDDAARTRNSDKSRAKSGAKSARSDNLSGSPAKSNDTGGSPAAALKIEEEMRALEENILPEVRGGEETLTHDSGSSSDDSLFEAAKDSSSSGSEAPKSRVSSHRSDKSIKSSRSKKESRATSKSSRRGESSVSKATSGLSHARSAESGGASRKSGGEYSKASLKKSSASNASSSSDSEFEAARSHDSGSENLKSRVSSRSRNNKSARSPSSKYTVSRKVFGEFKTFSQ